MFLVFHKILVISHVQDFELDFEWTNWDYASYNEVVFTNLTIRQIDFKWENNFISWLHKLKKKPTYTLCIPTPSIGKSRTYTGKNNTINLKALKLTDKLNKEDK